MDMTEIRRLEEQKVGKIKLSDAIRIGAEKIPEGKNSYSRCALGTAYYGLTGELFTATTFKLHENWAMCIGRMFGVDEKISIAVSTRHIHGESRDSIATWLESQGL